MQRVFLVRCRRTYVLNNDNINKSISELINSKCLVLEVCPSEALDFCNVIDFTTLQKCGGVQSAKKILVHLIKCTIWVLNRLLISNNIAP